MVAKNDFNWPLVNIAPVLKDADLTLINLESPLIVNCGVTNEGMTFCGDYRFAKSLADSGVDAANLANNHSLNYGWEGLGETEAHLHEAGIETTGFNFGNNSPQPSLSQREGFPPLYQKARGEEGFVCQKDIYCSKLVIQEIPKSRHPELVSGSNNIKLGFLGYNAVGQTVDRKQVEQKIRAADKRVDVLIVSVHWGKEYEREPHSDPSLAPDDPKELGRLFIDWGVDVVVGNHPHWYQGIEWYSSNAFASAKATADKQGKTVSEASDNLFAERSRSITYKPIFYALGNTIFDQEWSPETKVGYLAKLKFIGTEIKRENVEIIPIGIRDYGQAYLLEGKEREAVLHFLFPE